MKNEQDTSPEQEFSWEQQKLSFVGSECYCIPAILCHTYGPVAVTLDVSFNALTTLKGLDNFSQLQELVLDNNLLNDEVDIPRLETLHTLSLNKNRVTNLDRLLRILSERLPNLRYLSLLGNDACPDQLTRKDKDEDDYQRYRYHVLYRLHRLKFLDHRAVTVEERLKAMKVGAYSRTVQGVEQKMEKNDGLGTEVPPYTPLPRSRRLEGTHSGAYGKRRYQYLGKHSEGNRFIRDVHL